MEPTTAPAPGPLWDQLTLFGPISRRPEPAAPLQLHLLDLERNAAVTATADLMARAKRPAGMTERGRKLWAAAKRLTVKRRERAELDAQAAMLALLGRHMLPKS